jgi:hypothetical protein
MVEVFAPGVAISTEDFKRISVKKKAVKSNSKYFAAKGYDDQLASFIRNIKKGIETDITVRDGVRATLGCLKILESAQTGRPLEMHVDEAM